MGDNCDIADRHSHGVYPYAATRFNPTGWSERVTLLRRRGALATEDYGKVEASGTNGAAANIATVRNSFAGGVCMSYQRGPDAAEYPHGRGYGHDYMRGGEVFGGYGYSEREEYEKPRGELEGRHDESAETDTGDDRR